MGISSDGLLVFGIDYGEELPEQWQEYEDFDLEDYLADEAGLGLWKDSFTDEESSEYFRRQREIVESAPVSMELYCSYDYPMFILSIPGKSIRVSRGYTEEITQEKLQVSDEEIEKMKQWCLDQGLEWSQPKWYLCSMYG